MKVKSILLIAIFLTGGSLLFAQSDTSRIAYNVHFGNMDYSGDYATEFYSFSHGISGGAGVSWYLNPSFEAIGELNYGRVHGNNEGPRRNKGLAEIYHFAAVMGQADITFKYKFNNGYMFKESAKVAPYAIAGFGLIYSVSEGLGHMGLFEGPTAEKVLVFNLNLGLGVKYQMNSNWGIYLQSKQLMPLSDRFDGWYINIPANKKNDVFLLNAIGLVFTPGK